MSLRFSRISIDFDLQATDESKSVPSSEPSRSRVTDSPRKSRDPGSYKYSIDYEHRCQSRDTNVVLKHTILKSQC